MNTYAFNSRYPQQEELARNDVRHVMTRCPRDIRDLLTENHGRLFLAGGFIREIVAGNAPSDIDLFVDSADRAKVLADDLVKRRGGEKNGTKLHTTKNAITVITPNRLPVQFIIRWTFGKGSDLVRSFDFTVCQVAIWRGGNASNSEWRSLRHVDFYKDLAGRNLVYTAPEREEEAGGSALRVLKFLKRGYTIQVGSYASVIDRLLSGMDALRVKFPDYTNLACLDVLLREVDPLMVIDGFDVEDDHEPFKNGDSEND